MPETTRLSVDDLRTDGGTQPRSSLDERTITEYSRAMERGVEFPPVKVMYDGSNYWLFDGFHRLEATCAVGRDTIKAQVYQGTQEDAQWASLSANKAHGLRRTREDKRRAIKKALRGWATEMSNNAIARHIGCSDVTVGKYRKQLEEQGDIPEVVERTAQREGKAYTQNTENVGSHTQEATAGTAPEEPASSEEDVVQEDDAESSERSSPEREHADVVEGLKKSCCRFLASLDGQDVPEWMESEVKPVLDRVYRVVSPGPAE